MIRAWSFVAGAVLVSAAFGVLWAGEREEICARGYAASRRPSEEWSQATKRRMCEASGMVVANCMRLNELDHVIPLCLGGAPKDPANLQLQPWPEAHEKDRQEAEACQAYCEGKLELEAARALFHRDD